MVFGVGTVKYTVCPRGGLCIFVDECVFVFFPFVGRHKGDGAFLKGLENIIGADKVVELAMSFHGLYFLGIYFVYDFAKLA